jgi:penicillin-binding protein-related factor A (putative recombinase)
MNKNINSTIKNTGKVLEKNIVDAIKQYLKTLPKCFFFKEHGGVYGQTGIPDLIICYKGQFIAVEVKTPTGVISEIQKHTIQKINNSDGLAIIAYSVDDVKTAINVIDNEVITELRSVINCKIGAIRSEIENLINENNKDINNKIADLINKMEDEVNEYK